MDTDQAIRRPAVRVGISTKNRAPLLRRALDSVYQQSYQPLEVVVVDDGSDDDTPMLREQYPAVRWIRRDVSLGYLSARNEMMRLPGADYFVCLDDDAWFIGGDEIERAVAALERSPTVGGVAYDILDPGRTRQAARGAPRIVDTFIGCGHVLRLSAAELAGWYVPNPAFYGGEELDLSLRLLDRGFDVVLLPGVHVWHDKTVIGRDLAVQRREGVCNDLAGALRTCPLPDLLWLLPGKVASHVLFAARAGAAASTLAGIVRFLGSIRPVLRNRAPVRRRTHLEFRRRGRHR